MWTLIFLCLSISFNHFLFPHPCRLQKTISSASEERRQILLQQYQLVKSQISAKDVLKKKKTNSVPSNNVNSSKYFLTKPVEPSIYKSNSADIVCDKNLGQTLLEGLRALEQEKWWVIFSFIGFVPFTVINAVRSCF